MKDVLIQNQSLKKLNSWHIGGLAEFYYRPSDCEDLSACLRALPHEQRISWLGLGSNLLIRDAGVEGTVIHTVGLKAITLHEGGLVRAEAGVTLGRLARFLALASCTECAFFAGIPGTVGGALAMNAGAYGRETWSYVQQVETIDRSGQRHIRPASDFELGYRHVVGRPDETFIAGYFQFPQGSTSETVQAIKTLLKNRAASQPIGRYSCGSVFRNPPGHSAARLIELANLKGVRIGDAQVAMKHANFILNIGNAKANDVEQLIAYIIERVESLHGIKLMPEVRIIGRA